MPDKYWVGTVNNTVWNNNTTAWSTSPGGTPGNFVPASGETVYITRNLTAEFNININTNIGGVAKLVIGDPTSPYFRYYLAGTSTSVSGSKWTLTNDVEIEVSPVYGNTVEASMNFPIGGAFKVTKTGPGNLYLYGNVARDFSGGMDVQSGYIGLADRDNNFGTGTITLAHDTGIFNGHSLGTGRYLANEIVVNGDVKLGGRTYASNNGLLNFQNFIHIPGSTRRKITVDSTGSDQAAAPGGLFISSQNKGIVSSVGFIKDGPGQMYIYWPQTSLYGAVEVLEGSLYLGWDNVTTNNFSGVNAFPYVSALSIASGASSSVYIYNSTPTNVTLNYDINIDGGFDCSNHSPSGTVALTLNGNITGSGILSIGAWNLGLAGPYTARVQSKGGPSKIKLDTNGNDVGDPRTALWQYIGDSRVHETSFWVNQGGNEYASGNSYIIENVSDSKYTTNGGVELRTIGAYSWNRTLTVATTNEDIEIRGSVVNVNGSLSLLKTGTRKLILKGNNTFTGSTTVNAGTLELGSLNVLSQSTLTLNSTNPNPTITASSGITGVTVGSISLPTGTTLTLPVGVDFKIGNKNTAMTQTGKILGSSASLVKIGTSTLTLSNVDNLFGQLKLHGGTIIFADTRHIGGSATTLVFGKSGSENGALTFTFSPASALTLLNSISSYEGVVFSSVQNLTLNGNITLESNTFTERKFTFNGNTTINGSISGGSGITLRITMASGKTASITSDNFSLLSGWKIFSGQVSVSHDGSLGSVSSTADIVVENGGALRFSSSVNMLNSGRTTKIIGTGVGNGALHFDAPVVTYLSPIRLVGDSTIKIASSSSVSLNSIDLGSGKATIDSGPLSTTTVSHPLTGSGTFERIGSGSVIVTPSGTFTGVTKINAGITAIEKPDSLGGISSNIEISGGTLKSTVASKTRLKVRDLKLSGGTLKFGS